MSLIVLELTQGISDPAQADALWWSLAIGADFGGNLTAIGASANVVVLGIAKRSGYPISFWDFTRKGSRHCGHHRARRAVLPGCATSHSPARTVLPPRRSISGSAPAGSSSRSEKLSEVGATAWNDGRSTHNPDLTERPALTSPSSAPGRPGRRPGAPIQRSSGTSASPPTSTTASRRWPTGCCS